MYRFFYGLCSDFASWWTGTSFSLWGITVPMVACWALLSVWWVLSFGAKLVIGDWLYLTGRLCSWLLFPAFWWWYWLLLLWFSFLLLDFWVWICSSDDFPTGFPLAFFFCVFIVSCFTSLGLFLWLSCFAFEFFPFWLWGVSLGLPVGCSFVCSFDPFSSLLLEVSSCFVIGCFITSLLDPFCSPLWCFSKVDVWCLNFAYSYNFKLYIRVDNKKITNWFRRYESHQCDYKKK